MCYYCKGATVAKTSVLPSIDQWPRVIVVQGNDMLGKEKVKEQIRERLYGAQPTFVENHFDSSHESLEEYLIRLITPTLFGDFRLFTLVHAQKFSVQETKQISTMIPLIGDDALLVLDYEFKGGKGGKRAAPKELQLPKYKKSGEVLALDFATPKRYELAQWVSDQVRTLFNRRMSKDGAETLIDYIGEDVGQLYSELQKLDIYLPEGAPVDKEAIEAVSGVIAQSSPFDLANALGHRKWNHAYPIINRLSPKSEMKPGDVLPVLSILYRHFWKLYKIRCYAEENGRHAMSYFSAQYKQKSAVAYEIGTATGIIDSKSPAGRAYPVMVIPDVIGQARNYKRSEFLSLFTLLLTYDREVKTGVIRATQQNFSQLCFQIIRLGKVVK